MLMRNGTNARSPSPWTEGGRRITDTRTSRIAAEPAASSDDARGSDDVLEMGMSSVATRPCPTSAVTDVKINERSEPAKAEPRASIARRSVSEFSLYLEKSWMYAV